MIEVGSIVEVEVVVDDEQEFVYGLVVNIAEDGLVTVKVPNVGYIKEEIDFLRPYDGEFVIIEDTDGYVEVTTSGKTAVLHFDSINYDYEGYDDED